MCQVSENENSEIKHPVESKWQLIKINLQFITYNATHSSQHINCDMNLFKFIYLITFNFICSQKLIERTILDIKNNKELIIIPKESGRHKYQNGGMDNWKVCGIGFLKKNLIHSWKKYSELHEISKLKYKKSINYLMAPYLRTMKPFHMKFFHIFSSIFRHNIININFYQLELLKYPFHTHIYDGKNESKEICIYFNC